MANVITDSSNYINIANSIRSKLGTDITYKPSEMAAAINSIGGSSDGIYSISPCTNFKAVAGDSKVTLTWNDPENTIVNGNEVGVWTSTKIVRKVGSYPTSINDGTIVLNETVKNQYSTTGWVDTNVENETTYYYSAFAIANGVASDDISVSAMPVKYNTILKNNTWDKINSASEAGLASSLWSIGDEIDVEIAGVTYTFQIYGFNIDDKADGSGKAGITFGMKNLLATTSRMNSSNTNSGSWANTEMRNKTLSNYYNNMQSDVKSVIKTVNKITGTYNGSSTGGSNITTQDNLFLFSGKEVGLGRNYSTTTEYNACQTYPIFTDNNSRIKKLSNGSGSANWWWGRSPFCNGSDACCRVYFDGSADYGLASNSGGVAFGFCI